MDREEGGDNLDEEDEEDSDEEFDQSAYEKFFMEGIANETAFWIKWEYLLINDIMQN